MFEVSFHDERYLPFEYAGAVSRWRIELPQDNNQFDLDTLSDLVLHLNFTAREGGELLRHAANKAAQRHLPGAGVRFFDIRHDFPDAWAGLRGDITEEQLHRELPLRMSHAMFPFLPGRCAIRIHRLDLFFEAPGADPSESRAVEFLVGHRPGHAGHEDCDCRAPAHRVRGEQGMARALPRRTRKRNCRRFTENGYRDIGTFRFHRGIGEISRAFLLCGYATTNQRYPEAAQ